jgi:anti-sigma factor RsiW
MTTCSDFEALARDRLTGDLDEAGAARLDAHLADCTACRAEADALADLLALAKLPLPSQREMRALTGVADGVLRTFRVGERKRNMMRGLAVAIAVAAAVVVMALAPALMRGRSAVEPSPWQVPDLDALWAVSSVVDPDALTENFESGAAETDVDVLSAAYGDTAL